MDMNEAEKPNIKIMSFSDLAKFDTMSADFYVNFSKINEIVYTMSKNEIIFKISDKIDILKDILTIKDIEDSKIKNSFPTKNKNMIIDIVFGEKDIKEFKEKEEFVQVAVGVLYLINDFDISKRINDEKTKLIERLEKLNEIEKLYNEKNK